MKKGDSTKRRTSTVRPDAVEVTLGDTLAWGIQRWIAWSGRRTRISEASWLEGPVGDDYIGTEFYAGYAAVAGLEAVADEDAGLLPDFGVLMGGEFDPSLVDPEIRDFYERTACHDLDVQVRWSGPFKHPPRTLIYLVGRNFGQFDIPLSPSTVTMENELVRLRDPATNETPYAGWLRRSAATGEAMLAGLYTLIGGSTIGEALNILEGYPVADLPRRGDALHYYLEASRYAYADRGEYLGDPDYVYVPLRGLLSDGFAQERRSLITETAAQSPVEAGNPYPYDGGMGTVGMKASTAVEGPSTTHLTVSDRWGNIVSYTFTIEQTGGSAITVPNHGFILNNELTDFEPTPGLANAPAGGKRPRSSISPTIVTRDGHPMLALGSPGGSTIITTVLQTLVNDLDFGMTLPEAIAAPRASQRNTAQTSAEPAFLDTQ